MGEATRLLKYVDRCRRLEGVIEAACAVLDAEDQSNGCSPLLDELRIALEKVRDEKAAVRRTLVDRQSKRIADLEAAIREAVRLLKALPVGIISLTALRDYKTTVSVVYVALEEVLSCGSF